MIYWLQYMYFIYRFMEWNTDLKEKQAEIWSFQFGPTEEASNCDRSLHCVYVERCGGHWWLDSYQKGKAVRWILNQKSEAAQIAYT